MKKLTILLLLVCFATPAFLFGVRTRNGKTTVSLGELPATLDKLDAEKQEAKSSPQSPMGAVARAKQALAQKGFHLSDPEDAELAKATETDPDPAEPMEEAPPTPDVPAVQGCEPNPEPADEAQESAQAEENAPVQGCEPKPEPTEYSDFEDDVPFTAAATQKGHSKLWKMWTDPSSPTSLIGLLKEVKDIPADEALQYQSYVQRAITTLADQFDTNHNRSTATNVWTKRDICRTNRVLTEQLMEIMQLAQKTNISIDPKVKSIAHHWIEKNKEAIKEFEKAAQEEVSSFLEVQKDEDVVNLLKLFTIKGQIARLGKIKADRLKDGPKKPANMQKVMEICAALRLGLDNGTANLEDVEKFVEICNEKEIELDARSLDALQKALIQQQQQNDQDLYSEALNRQKVNIRLESISDILSSIIDQTFVPTTSRMQRTADTPFITFVGKFGHWKQLKDTAWYDSDECLFSGEDDD